jgi:hypothetical protein
MENHTWYHVRKSYERTQKAKTIKYIDSIPNSTPITSKKHFQYPYDDSYAYPSQQRYDHKIETVGQIAEQD